MNRYESYENTGLDWVPEIPEHWSFTRSKYIFRNKSVKNCPDEPLLSVTQKDGVVLRSESDLNVWNPTEDVSGYKLIEPSNFVISLRSFEGGLELSTIKGIVSPAYTVLEKTKKINDPYFRWLMKSHQFIIELNKHVTGIRQGKNIGWDDFSNIYLTVPPIEEQKLISRYLDKKTNQIDSLVEKIQKKIELLKEQRTSLINQYVTKGLDPNVEMKDSGVEWIGEIPRHWTIVRLRFLCDIKTGGKDTQDNVENGSYPFFVRSPNVERINSFSFDGEAVLTSGDGAGVGKIFHYFVGKFDYHQRVYKFSNFKDVSGKYFYWFLKENFQYEILRWNAKSTVDSVRLPFLQNFPMVLPPIEEQENLLFKIDSIDDRVEKLVQRLMKKIDILKEYRKSLISSVVTGKVRVTEDMI